MSKRLAAVLFMVIALALFLMGNLAFGQGWRKNIVVVPKDEVVMNKPMVIVDESGKVVGRVMPDWRIKGNRREVVRQLVRVLVTTDMARLKWYNKAKELDNQIKSKFEIETSTTIKEVIEE